MGRVTGEKTLEIGAFGWLVRYEHDDTWLDFKAYEVVSVQGLTKLYGHDGPNAFAPSPDLVQPDLEGYVKWDGCCEMTGPKPHFCGADDVANHATVMRELHKLCLLLPSVDHDCAGYPEPSHSPREEP